MNDFTIYLGAIRMLEVGRRAISWPHKTEAILHATVSHRYQIRGRRFFSIDFIAAQIYAYYGRDSSKIRC